MNIPIQNTTGVPKLAVVVYLDNATGILVYALERSAKLPSESCHLFDKVMINGLQFQLLVVCWCELDS